jgi:NTP pyrophosphatase (non-canonical NTP hydrolase)
MITDEQVESINQITEAMHTNSADHGFHVNDSVTLDIDHIGSLIADIHANCSEEWEQARKGVLISDQISNHLTKSGEYLTIAQRRRVASSTQGVVSLGRMGTFIANLHGEVSELWDASMAGRLNTQCDKPVSLTCAEEELADIVIRVMDTAKSLGVNLGRAIQIKSEYNRTRPFMHGKKA